MLGSFVLIGVFILFPSIAIFLPIFFDSQGQFLPWQFLEVLKRRYIITIIGRLSASELRSSGSYVPSTQRESRFIQRF